MGSFGVVVSDPGADQFAGMGQVAEQGLVQKLVAQPAVEAFHKAVLHRLSGGDVVPLDMLVLRPFENGMTCNFCPVVTDDSLGFAASGDDRIKLSCQPVT